MSVNGLHHPDMSFCHILPSVQLVLLNLSFTLESLGPGSSCLVPKECSAVVLSSQTQLQKCLLSVSNLRKMIFGRNVKIMDEQLDLFLLVCCYDISPLCRSCATVIVHIVRSDLQQEIWGESQALSFPCLEGDRSVWSARAQGTASH